MHTERDKKHTRTCNRINKCMHVNSRCEWTEVQCTLKMETFRIYHQSWCIPIDCFNGTRAHSYVTACLSCAIDWVFFLFSFSLSSAVSLLVRHNNIVMKVIINKLWLNGSYVIRLGWDTNTHSHSPRQLSLGFCMRVWVYFTRQNTTICIIIVLQALRKTIWFWCIDFVGVDSIRPIEIGSFQYIILSML